MAFAGFVTERGAPYRSIDLFDEVSAPLELGAAGDGGWRMLGIGVGSC